LTGLAIAAGRPHTGIMDKERHEAPTFWGVWTAGHDGPELCVSEDAAIKRAYELALSRVGLTVHLMQMTSAGHIRYPLLPSAYGVLARNPPHE
jgi:hypothetical protein